MSATTADHPAPGARLGPGATVIDDTSLEVEPVESIEQNEATNPIEEFVHDQHGQVGHALEYALGKTQQWGIEPKTEYLGENASTTARVGGSIMVVAQGVIIAVVALIVLGSLYNTDIVANPEYNNTWTTMFDTFADYGSTAFTLIGVGLIAVGAGVALSYFGGMGGMGGGR
ncbi:hypothetical protein [Halogeometricum limi]|uniref:Uncharacterized protein n=1 Tax=Halogeometricum limi TaxID=555875 RepID=A0A1I6FW44_9EURY|nr:hypothetical protein [Halogeometricum limi]SFR34185.1 hypothetical protein SAMN04488124_0419 [Halogeometricum limi]